MEPLKEGISVFLDKKMDRREFLAIAASSMLIITGIAGTLDRLRSVPKISTPKTDPSATLQSPPQASGGYGSSAYGE